MSDTINHPAHYTEGRRHEPIDVIEDWELGFNLGQVVKYISRAGRKPDTPAISDLRKAAFYLDRQIALALVEHNDELRLGVDGVPTPGGVDRFNHSRGVVTG